MRSLNERKKAWKAFEKATNNLQKDIYPLELIRHARVFSKAPDDDRERYEKIIMYAAKKGNSRATLGNGKLLFNWKPKYRPLGYELIEKLGL